MKKISKIILVIGLCLIFISLACSKFDVTKLLSPFYDDTKYEQMEIISSEELNKIIINTNDDNIIIRATTDDKIKITYYESDDDTYNYEIKNGVLTLKNKIKLKFFDLDFNFYYKDEIIIDIPLEMILDYEIKTSDGKLKVDNVMVNNLVFKTSNGKIEISDAVISDTLSIKSSNGKIILEDVEAMEITGSSSNGSIELKNVVADKIQLGTSNGKIKFENLESPYMKLTTSNGRISGNINGIADEYRRYLKTSNGSITIDDIEYSNHVEDSKINQKYIYLKTSNGGIQINFNY